MKNIFFILFAGLCSLVAHQSFGQSQSCPLNINFALDKLTHWEAYTGNNIKGNDEQTRQPYDSTLSSPNGTLNVQSIMEYNLPGVPGIQVLNTNSSDPYGGFQ